MVEKEQGWTTEICPKDNLLSVDFKEIWRYRDLMMLFVKRNIITQYKQTIIEIALRSYNFMFRANTKEDGMLCDILVELPDVLQYDMFDLDAIDEIYRMGYHETKLALQKNGPL